MTEKRFIVSNGELLEYNYLIDAWHEVDLEKICDLLNDFDPNEIIRQGKGIE